MILDDTVLAHHAHPGWVSNRLPYTARLDLHWTPRHDDIRPVEPSRLGPEYMSSTSPEAWNLRFCGRGPAETSGSGRKRLKQRGVQFVQLVLTIHFFTWLTSLNRPRPSPNTRRGAALGRSGSCAGRGAPFALGCHGAGRVDSGALGRTCRVRVGVGVFFG